MTKFPYKIIDLTHMLDGSIPSWSGDCGFKIELKIDNPNCLDEVQFRVQHFEMQAGIGTHIDAPAHCNLEGVTIEQLSLSDLVAPCFVMDVSKHVHERYSVSLQDIENFEQEYGIIPKDSFVMIRTGWEQFWTNSDQYRNSHLFPSISQPAAQKLLRRDIKGIGIDTLSPDRPEDGFPVHHLFLGSGKYIIENAANLKELPIVGSFIMAFPLKIKGGCESPIRLLGLVKN